MPRRATDDRGAVSNTAPQNYKAAIIASRPDYLTVSLPDPEQEYLPELMSSFTALLLEVAKGESVETSYEFCGATLFCQRSAAGLPRLVADGVCELRFYAHEGRVAAQFTVFSLPFWMDDAIAVFAWAQGLICQICGREVAAVPVRLDLARDVTGFDLDQLSSLGAIYAHFVTRSRKKRAMGGAAPAEFDVVGGRHVESVYLGGPSAPVRWNVYDKSLQVIRKGKTYYQPIWEQGGWDPSQRVTRFEARLTGRVWQELARYGVQNGLPALTLENLHEWVAPLWAWLSISHTRMVEPDGEQTNRSRLVTSAFWCMMQCPFPVADEQAAPPVALQRLRYRQPSREALGMQAEGALLTLAALVGGGEYWSRAEVGETVADLVGWRCATKGLTWAVRVRQRRALLAVSLATVA